ncbi:hypothetical protein H6769_04755 [Candidatus Peribacteria bacterium]|nr:hypothetical protein [Candidatus Peribacteria bacterium]
MKQSNTNRESNLSQQSYTLTCTGSNGTSVSQNVTVNVASPVQPTILFLASSTSITSGASTTLTWSTTNATACTASNFTLPNNYLTSNTSKVVSPTSTTIYTLTCTSPDGISLTTGVTVEVSVSSCFRYDVLANGNLKITGYDSKNCSTTNIQIHQLLMVERLLIFEMEHSRVLRFTI